MLSALAGEFGVSNGVSFLREFASMKISKLLTVEMFRVDTITPYAKNARKSSRRRDKHLTASIKAFGFASPILTDPELEVIAGHARLEAAKRLGLKEVPIIRLWGLSDDDKKALRIADNRIAELGGWTPELLQIDLQALVDSQFDMEATGFGSIDLDKVLTPDFDLPGEDERPVPATPDVAVSRQSDLWALGKHRLFCGDSTKPESYEALLGVEKADLLLTDPPYNVRIADVVGNGRSKHEEFAMASGEMSADEFSAFLKTVLENVIRQISDGALAYVFADWRMISDLVAVGNQLFDRHMNICVWVKSNAGMGSHYRSAHELVAVFKYGSGTHVNNIQLGRLGRNRTNVWQYDGASAFSKTRGQDLADHPTVKPLAMIGDIIRDATQPGNLVIDPFCGSGTTILAAQLTGRRAAAIEIEPKFVDVTLRRFQERTGVEPMLLPAGTPLSAVRAERGVSKETAK
jgi:DNA modification methylase